MHSWENIPAVPPKGWIWTVTEFDKEHFTFSTYTTNEGWLLFQTEHKSEGTVLPLPFVPAPLSEADAAPLPAKELQNMTIYLHLWNSLIHLPVSA